MSILSVSVADLWAILVGRVIWGMKLLDRTISKNWHTPVFCVHLVRFELKLPTRIVLLLYFILLSRFFIVNIKFIVLHGGVFVNCTYYKTWFIWGSISVGLFVPYIAVSQIWKSEPHQKSPLLGYVQYYIQGYWCCLWVDFFVKVFFQ